MAIRIPAHIFVGSPGQAPVQPAAGQPAGGGQGAAAANGRPRQARPNGTFVGTEQRWLFGPAEGCWWRHYAWWVMPLGLLLLLSGWWLYFTGPSKSAAPSVTPAPAVTAPAVVAPVACAPPAPTCPAAVTPRAIAPVVVDLEPIKKSIDRLSDRIGDRLGEHQDITIGGSREHPRDEGSRTQSESRRTDDDSDEACARRYWEQYLKSKK